MIGLPVPSSRASVGNWASTREKESNQAGDRYPRIDNRVSDVMRDGVDYAFSGVGRLELHFTCRRGDDDGIEVTQAYSAKVITYVTELPVGRIAAEYSHKSGLGLLATTLDKSFSISTLQHVC